MNDRLNISPTPRRVRQHGTDRAARPASTSAGRRPRRTRSASLLVAAAILLSACGSSDEQQVASATPGGSATSGAGPGAGSDSDLSPQQQGQRFADCLRENGLPVGDADEKGEVGFDSIGDGVSGEDRVRAYEACEDVAYAPSASDDAETMTSEEQRAFANCMRDKGLDWPDADSGSTVVGSEVFDSVDEATMERYLAECAP